MLDLGPDIAMQRARGRAELVFEGSTGTSRLSHLHQSGCLKVMIPRNHADVPDAVLINTAGGLTGGDALLTKVDLRCGAKLRLTTQTAERIYKSTGDTAKVALEFTVGNNCELDWLAQETILFDQGRVQRKIHVEMAPEASLLMVEPIVLGRLLMGEKVQSGSLQDTWRIYRGGHLVFADDTRLDDFTALKRPATFGGAVATASLLWVDPNAEAIKSLLFQMSPPENVELGYSAWNGFAIVRCLATDPFEFKKTLSKVIETIRGRGLPRVWTM